MKIPDMFDGMDEAIRYMLQLHGEDAARKMIVELRDQEISEVTQKWNMAQARFNRIVQEQNNSEL